MIKKTAVTFAILSLLGCTMVQIPATNKERVNFFLNETHSITAGKCGWLGDVYVTTGPSPSIKVGGTYYSGENPQFSEDAYTFNFNKNTLMFTLLANKNIAGVAGNDTVTPCRYTFISN